MHAYESRNVQLVCPVNNTVSSVHGKLLYEKLKRKCNNACIFVIKKKNNQLIYTTVWIINYRKYICYKTIER